MHYTGGSVLQSHRCALGYRRQNLMKLHGFALSAFWLTLVTANRRRKKRQMALSERSSGWKICPFYFFPLNELKGYCHLMSERITKAAGAEGSIHTSLWKPCMFHTHLSMLHHLLSPSLAFFHLVQQQGGI